ncbi:hypothetical protein HQ533_04430 [Candidatus Woesearchaeota archaeon]|nr:hypothetical protein [Candidatus Woesearchaeota archaeon]
MNVKKAIKKIVALGSGLTMIGATIMGATADLSGYPAPFVQNGMFSGKIIVGANAATSDVLGAIDISASLQADAKTGVSIAATAATATVEGGVLIEDANNQDFNYGDSFSASSIDDDDFSSLLADGVLEDDDGQEFDFAQEVTLGNETMSFGLVDNDVYDDPVLYLDLNNAGTDYILTFDIDFDAGDDANWLLLDDSEDLFMFGTAWTVKNIATGDDMILFGSDVTQTVSLNNPIDIEVDGTTYTLNIVGANSDDSEVHISVNGAAKSVGVGATKTIGGLQIYVQDVFISTVGGESASANLFIGSKELNLGSTFADWEDVQVDDEDLDGVEVYMTGNETDVSRIQFRVDAEQVANADTGEDYDWLALGDTFTDPLFGFEVNFVEAIPGFTADSRDYVRLKSSGDDLEVTLINADGTEYLFSPYMYDGTVNISAGDDWVFAALNSVAKDSIFILEEDSSSSEPVSRIFEFKGADLSDDEADFKDIGSGQSLTVGSGDTLADTSTTITIDADDVVNLSAASETDFYTKSGALVTFTTTAQALTQTITVTEDEQAVNSDEVAGDVYTIEISYDTTDDEINVARPGSWDGDADDDDDGDYYYGVGEYGAYYKHEADESTELELWIPAEDTDYAVYLAGPGAAVSLSSGIAGATYYNVNPIGVGIGVLDTDAPTLGSTPMIVVGGPCANTVAAELMGNPANCVEGFEEGKAIIRFYADNNAVLVAGYSAMDTQGASRVLADYADWALSGSEVEVVVPSLSSISVNPVA